MHEVYIKGLNGNLQLSFIIGHNIYQKPELGYRKIQFYFRTDLLRWVLLDRLIVVQ